MPTSPEAAVKKLSRLPSNTICANCGTTSKYGFSTICIKYLTFVCNACKSSHQAISHRCKSLTMSSWDQGEVLKLKSHGNDYARRVWLATAPAVGSGGRPREGDDINLFKRFVVEVYENRKYYREPVAGVAGEVNVAVTVAPSSRGYHKHAASRQHQHEVTMPRASKQTKQPARVKQQIIPTAAAPVVDLLDFGAFDNASATAPVAATASTAMAPPDLFDPFTDSAQPSFAPLMNGNQPALPPAVVPNNSIAGVPAYDPFGGNNSVISVASTATTGIVQQQQQVMKAAPIMNNSGGGMTNNGGMMDNNGHNNMGMMNGGMMNGGMMNSNMMNGGMMNSGMMNGGMMANNNMMNTTSGNSMMMGGTMNNGNGNGIMSSNNSMMNNNASMMNSNGMTSNPMMNGMATSSNPMNMSGNGIMGQQQLQQPAMNINVMQPMNNSISNNFVSGNGASKASAKMMNKKPDPFASLGF